MFVFFVDQICILICIYFCVAESSCGVLLFYFPQRTLFCYREGISTDKLAECNSPLCPKCHFRTSYLVSGVGCSVLIWDFFFNTALKFMKY